MDRQAASLLMIAAGVALAVYWYRLTREQRNSLVAGLTGKAPGGGATAPAGVSKPSRSVVPFTMPPPRPAAPSGPVDWLDAQKERFNRVLDQVAGMFRRAGVQPPGPPIQPFPVAPR